LAVALLPTVSFKSPTVAADPNNDDWLHVEGNKIVDMYGNQVWLTGCNWFGFNTGTNVFDGVWSCNMREALKGMADRGIIFENTYFNRIAVSMVSRNISQSKC